MGMTTVCENEGPEAEGHQQCGRNRGLGVDPAVDCTAPVHRRPKGGWRAVVLNIRKRGSNALITHKVSKDPMTCPEEENFSSFLFCFVLFCLGFFLISAENSRNVPLGWHLFTSRRRRTMIKSKKEKMSNGKSQDEEEEEVARYRYLFISSSAEAAVRTTKQ